MYNEGISKYGDLLDLATGLDIVTKRGRFIPMATSVWVRVVRGLERLPASEHQPRRRDRGCHPPAGDER